MNGPSRKSRVLLMVLVAAVALGVDLITKEWAWETVRHNPIIVQEGLLHFEFGFNTGAAFGILREAAWARSLFFVVAAAALVYLVRLAAKLPVDRGAPFVAIGLISSGVLGNLHDRLFRTIESLGEVRHGVVDFVVVFYWPGKRWPAFNVADAALVVGVGLFMLAVHRQETASRGRASAPVQGP